MKGNSNLIKITAFDLKKNINYLISLRNITTDLEINLFCNNKLISKQRSPIEKSNFDYIFIRANNDLRHCDISTKTIYNIKQNNLPLVNIKQLKNAENIDYYDSLYKIAILWNSSSNNTEQILDLINTQSESNLTIIQKEELLVYKLAVLYNSHKYQEVVNLAQPVILASIKNQRNKLYTKWYLALSSLNTLSYQNSIELLKSIYIELDGKKNLNESWKLFKYRVLAYQGLAKSVRYYFDKYQKDNGKNNIERALKEFSHFENNQFLAETLYFYGAYYSAIEDWEQSLATLDTAEKYCKIINDVDTLISIYNQKAIAYLKIGLVKKSIDNFRIAIKLANEMDKTKENNYLFSSIASVYEHLGNYIKSRRYYKNYLNQIANDDLFGKYSTYIKLGRIFRANNDINHAIEYHLKSQTYFKGKEFNSFVDITVELSIDYQKKQDYTQAKYFAMQVLVFSNLDKLNALEKTKLGMKPSKQLWENIVIISNKPVSALKFILSKHEINYQTEQQIKALKVLAIIAKNNENNLLLEKLLNKIELGVKLLPINHKLEYYQLKIDLLLLELFHRIAILYRLS